MFKLKLFYTVIFFAIYLGHLASQDFNGSRIGNYSNLNSLSTNPAHMHSGNLFWCLNLGGADLSFQQNYAGFKQSTYFSARKKLDLSEAESAHSDIDYIDALTNNDFEFSTFNIRSKISAHGQMSGPGFWMRAGDLGFGLFYNFQSWIDVHNAPYKSEIDYWNAIPSGTDFELEKMRLGIFSYSEIGLNCSYSLENNFDIPLILAMNAKYLIPHDAIYIANNEATISARFNDSLYVDRGDIRVDYFTGLEEVENGLEYMLAGRGYGFAFDLGLKYLSGTGPNGYKYKFGFALNDLGQIFYRNGAHHNFHFLDGYIDQSQISNEFIQVEAGKNDLDVINALYMVRSDKISFWTPAHIVADIDYGLYENYYITASVVRNIHLDNKIERMSYIMVAPRYESRWISASIPISLINDQFVRLGAFARFGPLSIGTDHLVSWLIPSNFRGSSVYMSLQINADFFDSLGWDISGANRRVLASSKKVKCYRF